ncbi:replication initiator protein A [Acuticoccus sediminis]|uniref:replication initiator protein A n=1 Tax=Acuticoccus sediminis TaxID=2184697 RepID=UPI001CFEED46|nr:replication initiator protein A [Acuticoccus sediminis]
MSYDTPQQSSLPLESARDLATLLPERHPEQDLFICDVADAVLKDLMQHMEHPFYSLSKKPETAIRRYEHNGNWIEITPSVKGLATIYDKDILIYCISQIMAKLNRGEAVSQNVRINSRDLLIFTNRGTAGKDYAALAEALDRLAGTRISTNVRAGDEEEYSTFGLIDAASIRRKHGLDGRLLWCEVKLSDWVFKAIRAQDVLTLHPDYFRLRKPIERRLYELARKHCGAQAQWRCSVQLLHKKSGSKSPLKQFRYLLKDTAETDHLPDYHIAYDETDDKVVFVNRNTMQPALTGPHWIDEIRLDSDTYEAARDAAPGWDPYFIEAEWRNWLASSEKTPPRKPDLAFIAFCARFYERRGAPA